MSGIVGLLFREFAVTVAVSIVLSVVVSLSLTPMMCARLLKSDRGSSPGQMARALERLLDGLVPIYDRALTVVPRHPPITLTGMHHTVRATIERSIRTTQDLF